MTVSIVVHKWSELDDLAREKVLRRPSSSQDPSVLESARDIVNSVRKDGDRAIRELTRAFDQADIEETRVTDAEIESASASLTAAQLAAIDFAIMNVRKFHELQVPGALSVDTVPGVRCERLSHALDSVGLYVPAGTAPLPSAAIMLAIPATVAGCPRIVLCTPPRPDGSADPAVLVAASRTGSPKFSRLAVPRLSPPWHSEPAESPRC